MFSISCDFVCIAHFFHPSLSFLLSVEISRLPIHYHIWHDLIVDFHIDLIDIISDIFVMIRHHTIFVVVVTSVVASVVVTVSLLTWMISVVLLSLTLLHPAKVTTIAVHKIHVFFLIVLSFFRLYYND